MTLTEQLAASRRKALEAVIVIQARLHELEGAIARDPSDLSALEEARVIGSLLASIARGRYRGCDTTGSVETCEP